MMQRKKVKKFLSLVVMLAAMSSVLTGCGSSAEQTAPTQESDSAVEAESKEDNAAVAADGEKVELRFLL